MVSEGGGDWKVVASTRNAGVDPLGNCVDGTFKSSFLGALRDWTAADGFVGGPRCAYYLKVNINDWK